MGIDARIFSRFRGPKPTTDQINRWSWDLVRAIGHDKFFLDPEQGRGALRLSIVYGDDRGPGRSRGDDVDPDLAGKCYQQDGPTLFAEEGEWFVEASLWTRYYGVDYERGDWMAIVHIAEWMERFIGPVWYGGDSSGVCAEPFGKQAREQLIAHALSENGRNYFNHSGLGEEPTITPAPCSLCVKDRGMNRYGYGPNFVAVYCGGCGRNFESRDNGKTWQKPKE